MYVVLERDRLWMFASSAVATGSSAQHDRESVPPSFIALPHAGSQQYKLVAQIVDSCVFSVTIDSQEGLHETVTFRTKNMDSAEQWVKSFYRLSESIRRKQLIKKNVSCASNHVQMDTKRESPSFVCIVMCFVLFVFPIEQIRQSAVSFLCEL